MAPKKVLFIHRSVGHNLINKGKVYELLKPYRQQIEFSDYDHNNKVLSWAGGKKKLGYRFPGNNTYPSNLADLFSSSDAKLKLILDWISQYDVVVIKSCYPTTKIKSDQELKELKKDYQVVVDYFSKSGQKLGLLTPPPMKPKLTKPEWAARARLLSQWLVSADFGDKVKVFDLFDLLSAKEGEKDANTLRKEYRRILFVDAHPNKKANLTIAPKFVDFIKSL